MQNDFTTTKSSNILICKAEVRVEKLKALLDVTTSTLSLSSNPVIVRVKMHKSTKVFLKLDLSNNAYQIACGRVVARSVRVTAALGASLATRQPVVVGLALVAPFAHYVGQAAALAARRIAVVGRLLLGALRVALAGRALVRGSVAKEARPTRLARVAKRVVQALEALAARLIAAGPVGDVHVAVALALATRATAFRRPAEVVDVAHVTTRL